MRCPVCKADNAQGPQCRRCKADLALLFDLEAARRARLDAARAHLVGGRWHEAAAGAEEANRLRRDGESQRLLAVARLLARDFAGAWECYREAQAPPA
ncbi:MAG TPA: hypothetical protein VFE78_17760 [Gemmataceae bacterium]|jgi:hypothetical protein|nr:hypothetical protein [Gemmataceae bacterium]